MEGSRNSFFECIHVISSIDNIETFVQLRQALDRLNGVQIPSLRANTTGIGKTLESALGIKENNISTSDCAGYELKAHREDVNTPITLFTLAPTSSNKNGYLRDTYGECYPENPTQRRLHTSFFADQRNTYMGKYGFQLRNDRNNQKVFIDVYDCVTGDLIDNSVFYTYASIEERLNRKLKQLILVRARRSFSDSGVEIFDFRNYSIYNDLSFDKFLDMLDCGKIQYDIRIGRYQSGVNKGKSHDHGSAFRIMADNLPILYKLNNPPRIKSVVSKSANKKCLRKLIDRLPDLEPGEMKKLSKFIDERISSIQNRGK